MLTPIYIRLGRGGEIITNSVSEFEIGKGISLKNLKQFELCQVQ